VAAPTTPQDLNGAARELARKTAALAGRGETVAVAWRDVSSLGSAALGQARNTFETALHEAGGRLGDVAPAAEAQLTLSENASQYLLVEEIRKGEERQVWIAAWHRGTVPAIPASAVMLETRLIWEQPEQMLDVALNGNNLWVLSGSALTRLVRTGGQMQVDRTAPIVPAKPWPRDLRGRLRWDGGNLQASLPGMVCGGTVDALSCRAGDEPWTLDSGRSLLLAALAPGRNYFDGRVVLQSGARKTVPPFYSAAAADDNGRPVWLLATVDGGTQMFDAALDPIGPAGAWGSDLAAGDIHCGGRSVVLATRPGDGREPDAVLAYSIVNRVAVPTGVPAEFPGPVTALWPSANGATAIVRTGATYQAYTVTVACGQ
jgi:hypothetical protein